MSIFMKTGAANLFVCLRPICTSLGHCSVGKCKWKHESEPHTHQNGRIYKLTVSSVDDDVEQLEPSYFAGGNVKRDSHFVKPFCSV